MKKQYQERLTQYLADRNEHLRAVVRQAQQEMKDLSELVQRFPHQPLIRMLYWIKGETKPEEVLPISCPSCEILLLVPRYRPKKGLDGKNSYFDGLSCPICDFIVTGEEQERQWLSGDQQIQLVPKTGA
jgi:hypothetical protein